ncbi:MAG: ribulose-phosphate 3-epimerase [Candidatus Thermoplasmatota archaeon]|jgi:ribulose-phosphate 3-epimerase|nr:ribulose-phosphate 3-epimerase [Candidatus Thermoplasmatota archaeon]MCL5789415.1 ribulose-phosphate 3-epimerase [Candidatus Thermoplasmatota archaeon]
MAELSASILAADLLNLERDIGEAIRSGIKWIHLDVMDGHFVPNLTMGIPFGYAINKKFDVNIESHMMVDNPDMYLDKYCSFSKLVTIHYESPVQTIRVLKEIEKKGAMPGISINPKTPVSSIEPLLQSVKYVLVMTVEPGFSGQELIEEAALKIPHLNEYRKRNNLDFLIGIDGGIKKENISRIAALGPDIIVSASAIFSGNIEENINSLRSCIKERKNGQ